MRKGILIVSLAIVLIASGCRANAGDSKSLITVVSREDGSGTRGAFVELFGVLVEEGGNESDQTTDEAIISNKTDAVLATVSNDELAIGYISLGAYNDSVKLLDVDGVKATKENVLSGEYKVFRPFNIALKETDNELANDFVKYIMSIEGQKVVGESFIPVDASETYQSSNLSGKLSIGGSTSVAPVMEKLVEAYKKLNPDVVIDIQANGSSAGMSGVIEGTFDIGMASRDLKDSEASELVSYEIAYDGIGIIVNNKNSLDNITKEQVRKIYTGEYSEWGDLSE